MAYIDEDRAEPGFRRQLNRRIETTLEGLVPGVGRATDSRSVRLCRELLRLLILRKWIGELGPAPKEEEGDQTYVAGSLFLHQSHRYLRSFDSEALHFVTGPHVDGKYFLDTLLLFRMSERSWVSAAGDVKATHRLLQTLDTFGHSLTCVIHSHPGSGAAATRPSTTDLAYQQRLEGAGYATIGAIFSQDGYLRFFSVRRPFTIETFGKGIKKEAQNVFRLVSQHNQEVPLPCY